MTEKTLIIYILLRVKLRNGKMKIIFAGSVKFTLTEAKKSLEKEKLGIIKVVFLELWLLLTSIVLIPISISFFFYLFNRLYLAY